MAISTYKVFLMKKNTTTYEKLCDITGFPSMMGAPEGLDATTLTDGQRVYIPGIREIEAGLAFTANYDKTTFDSIDADKETEGDYALWIGGTESGGVVTPTGSNGKLEVKGYLYPSIDEGGVNEVIGMTLTLMPTTPVTIGT